MLVTVIKEKIFNFELVNRSIVVNRSIIVLKILRFLRKKIHTTGKKNIFINAKLNSG